MSEIPTIPEFYNGKNIFITGGSGFIGKVLIEKLLRSCSGLNAIYLLMREKKGKGLDERVKDIIQLPLFDLLRSTKPDVLTKIKTINGDVKKLSLGLSFEDQKMLINQINIVFHVAASVRFDDNLSDAILLNARGTREVANLALQIKNLECFAHISTTYCNTDKKIIEEKVYAAHADWRASIKIAETLDKNVVNALTEKYIYPLPNTYTFTKSLAENVVYDLCNGKIPTIIYRPSVVTSTHLEPMKGWIDGPNSPISSFTGLSVGLVRVVYGRPDIILDCAPVDPTVKAMIMAPWKETNKKNPNEKLAATVYNGAYNHIHKTNEKELFKIVLNIVKTTLPIDNMLWYPSFSFCQSSFLYYIKFLCYQLLPALILDAIFVVIGQKPRWVRLQRKIYVASNAVKYFTFNEWKFLNSNLIQLEKELLPNDRETFYFAEDQFTLHEYLIYLLKGMKKHVLKEGNDLKKAKKHNDRLWVAAQIFNVVWYLGLLWLIFVKFDTITILGNVFSRV